MRETETANFEELLRGKLGHTRSCPALTPGDDEDCTCGLIWRVRLQTEMTMHNAWRKRAEEAESREQAAPGLRDLVIEECCTAVKGIEDWYDADAYIVELLAKPESPRRAHSPA